MRWRCSGARSLGDYQLEEALANGKFAPRPSIPFAVDPPRSGSGPATEVQVRLDVSLRLCAFQGVLAPHRFLPSGETHIDESDVVAALRE
jgi:hypothetical protein